MIRDTDKIIINYIKENLTIRIENSNILGEKCIKVSLILDGDVISTDTL